MICGDILDLKLLKNSPDILSVSASFQANQLSWSRIFQVLYLHHRRINNKHIIKGSSYVMYVAVNKPRKRVLYRSQKIHSPRRPKSIPKRARFNNSHRMTSVISIKRLRLQDLTFIPYRKKPLLWSSAVTKP